jgi:hypothetical protein
MLLIYFVYSGRVFVTGRSRPVGFCRLVILWMGWTGGEVGVVEFVVGLVVGTVVFVVVGGVVGLVVVLVVVVGVFIGLVAGEVVLVVVVVVMVVVVVLVPGCMGFAGCTRSRQT